MHGALSNIGNRTDLPDGGSNGGAWRAGGGGVTRASLPHPNIKPI